MKKINIIKLITTLLSILTTNSVYDTERFNLIDYEDINNLMENLKKSKSSSTIMRIKNIFDIYPDITPPICSKTEEKTPCKSFLIEIGDFEKGESSIKKIPTVFYIAGFHGNEVTGTNSLYYLLDAINKYYISNKSITNIIQNTRILILLTANINGFYNLNREEHYKGQSYDPNRDFPYNLQTGSKCFKTTTAMIINNIFKDNLIIASLTFHGGDNSISYPWGNFAHEEDPLTGDNIAFKEVSEFLTKAAGGNKQIKLDDYNVGNLQSTVYDVYGGFEDWAYGASWDLVNVPKNCSANKNYVDDITYNDNSNRAFIFLVEAGVNKIPKKGELGNEIEIFEPENDKSFNGYISRNAFLSLRFAEIMKPSLNFKRVYYDNNNLNFDAVIKGCLKLNEFYAKGVDLQIFDKKYNERYSYYNISFRINNNKVDIDQLNFLFNCDKNWVSKTDNKSPQSHLVKMRTSKNYNISMNNYKIDTKNYSKVTMLNIRQQNLTTSQVVYNGNNIFSLVYTRNLIIQTSDEKKDSIKLTNTDNKVSYTYNLPRARNLLLEVKKLTEDNKQNKLVFDLKNEEEQKINVDNYYNLVGRKIDVVEGREVFRSLIKFEESEKDSFLFIPTNGLTGTITNNLGTFIFTILLNELKSIKFEILTNNDADFKLVINNKEYSFNEKSLLKRNDKEIFKYEKEIVIDLENLNEYRFLGADLIYDNLKGEKFICELNQRNSYLDENESVVFDNLIIKIANKPVKSKNILYFSLILLFLMVLLTFVYFVISKRLKEKVYNEEIDIGLRNIELTV